MKNHFFVLTISLLLVGLVFFGCARENILADPPKENTTKEPPVKDDINNGKEITIPPVDNTLPATQNPPADEETTNVDGVFGDTDIDPPKIPG